MVGIASCINQSCLSGNPAVDGNAAPDNNRNFIHLFYLQSVAYGFRAIPFGIQKLHASILQHSEIPTLHFIGIIGILRIIGCSLKRKETVFCSIRHVQLCNFSAPYKAVIVQKQRIASRSKTLFALSRVCQPDLFYFLRLTCRRVKLHQPPYPRLFQNQIHSAIRQAANILYLSAVRPFPCKKNFPLRQIFDKRRTDRLCRRPFSLIGIPPAVAISFCIKIHLINKVQRSLP